MRKMGPFVCGVFLPTSSQSLRFILSLRINSSFITSRPGSSMVYVFDCIDS